MEKINRIVLMGSSQFAVPTLELLLEKKFNLVAVYTQPPRTAKRGKKTTPTPIQVMAEENNLRVITPLNFNAEDNIRQFESLHPEIVVVVSYGLILPKKLLSIPRWGFLNIHPSLLPRWRGAAPVQRTLMAGDKKTGVCIIKVVEKLDSGPIYTREEIGIDKGITASELSDQLARIGAKLTGKVLDNLDVQNLVPQRREGVCYAHKIDKDETRIDWNLSAQDICNKIHGLSHQPGAWFEHNGIRIKILKCELAELEGEPGRVLDPDMALACGKDSIRPTLIQRQGKSPMERRDFLRGYKLDRGELLS